jgi:hypothetical protein
MAARIEQLEQKLATMASLQHQSHSRGEASTSYGGDDLSYMVSVAHIEVFVAITSSIIRTSEPRGGTLELDPQRGEVSRQARLSQSFLLSEVVRIPSTVPTPPIELTMGPTTLTSRVVDTDVSSSAMSRMATSMLGSPSFSNSDLLALGIDLTRVFRLAATLCEHGSVDAMNAEVCEGVDVGQPMAGDVAIEQLVISGVDSPWQAAMAKMDALPIRPVIDRERFTLGVCMLDNQSGIFRLVSPTGQVYRPNRVLLDSSA